MEIGARIEMNPRVRTFLICAIALAFPVSGAGFEMGAYGQLLYDRKIVAWCTVSGALLALLLVPRRMAPASLLQLGVLAVPSIWLLAVMFAGSHPGEVMRPVLLVLTVVSCLFCLPYAVYLIVEIINPDLLNLEGWWPKLRLVAIAVVFFVGGFAIGARNDLLFTCEDFEIAGSHPPAECRWAFRAVTGA